MTYIGMGFMAWVMALVFILGPHPCRYIFGASCQGSRLHSPLKLRSASRISPMKLCAVKGESDAELGLHNAMSG